nr:nuclear transport factor 2 family protein [uncultured Lacibacter sp.]
MRKPYCLLILFCTAISICSMAQTKEDSAAITRAALDYIESQHKPNAAQMERALHPRLVKRTFWKDKATGKDYLYEYFAENMIILAERYNVKGDKFPANPRKEVKLLDVSDRTASIKLIADDWIDYMHLAKLNGTWKIVSVLWQFNDQTKHQ